MKTKKENHLNIKNNDFFYTQYSSHLSNSVLDSKSNLILNKINSNNSNLINSKSLHLTSYNKFNLTNSFNSKENDLNSPNLKKKDRNSISNQSNKIISEENDIIFSSDQEKVTFKQNETNSQSQEDFEKQLEYNSPISNKKYDSFNKNKILLNPYNISLYTKILLLKTFDEFLKTMKPIIFAEKTKNAKIKGFSSLNYNNKADNKNKISIDINIIDKKNNDIINYFSIFRKGVSNDFLKQIFKLNMNEQIEIFKKCDKEILIIKTVKDYISILHNINLKKSSNYISILSLNNGNIIKILRYQQIYKFNNNFDYIIIINKGIYKNIYCIEINNIIYQTLKTIICEKKTFENFLNDVIVNINKKVIENGGRSCLSIIFICLETIYNIFKNKDLNKINQILSTLENTSYEVDNDNRKMNQNNTLLEINSPIENENENYFNLTFKMKSLRNYSEKEQCHKKVISLFKCCGI